MLFIIKEVSISVSDQKPDLITNLSMTALEKKIY